MRSACDGLAGVDEEGLVPLPEGGKGLGSAMEGGPRGSMQSNGISSWAVSESYLCVEPLASHQRLQLSPISRSVSSSSPIQQAGTLYPSTGSPAVIICQGAGLLALASSLSLVVRATHIQYTLALSCALVYPSE